MHANMASCVMVRTWVWLRVLRAGASDAMDLGVLLRMSMSAMRWDRRGFLGESFSGKLRFGTSFFGGLGSGKSLWSNCNLVGTTGGDGASCILGEKILL